MPTFLENLFGQKKPTSAAVEVQLARIEADLAAAPGRIGAAKALMKRVAEMSEVEHAHAEGELAAARRSLVRLEGQASLVREALSEAQRAEAASALSLRADLARKRLSAMKGALDTYDARAAALVEAAAEIEAIEVEVLKVNREIDAARRAGLEAPNSIETPQQRFRTEPDHVTPEEVIVDEIFEVQDNRGRWVGATVLVERNREMVPEELGSRRRKIKRVIPSRIRPGRSIPSPLATLSIPASRVGGKTFWPRSPSGA